MRQRVFDEFLLLPVQISVGIQDRPGAVPVARFAAIVERRIGQSEIEPGIVVARLLQPRGKRDDQLALSMLRSQAAMVGPKSRSSEIYTHSCDAEAIWPLLFDLPIQQVTLASSCSSVSPGFGKR